MSENWTPKAGDNAYSTQFDGAGHVLSVNGKSAFVAIYWFDDPTLETNEIPIDQLSPSPLLSPDAQLLQAKLDVAVAELNRLCEAAIADRDEQRLRQLNDTLARISALNDESDEVEEFGEVIDADGAPRKLRFQWKPMSEAPESVQAGYAMERRRAAGLSVVYDPSEIPIPLTLPGTGVPSSVDE